MLQIDNTMRYRDKKMKFVYGLFVKFCVGSVISVHINKSNETMNSKLSTNEQARSQPQNSKGTLVTSKEAHN